MLSASLAFAADSVTGDFSQPSGVIFDSAGQDRGRAIAVDASSNVFVAGKKPQAGGGEDWVILKLNPSGVLLSSAALDSGANTFDEPMDGFVGGDSFLVAGGVEGSRRLQLFSTATLSQTSPFVGYSDGQPGRFTAVIASAPDGSRLIAASVISGQMFINEFMMSGFVNVSTRVIPGFYDAQRHGRSLARDPNTGHIFAVAVDSTTGGMRIEELGANLSLLGATNFFKPEPFTGGAALAWSGSGLYAVGVASGGAGSVTYIFRLSGLNLLAVTTITASGSLSNMDERVIAIDPNNQDVFVSGSGPFPGLYKFSSDLVGSTLKTFFPTSSLAVQDGANLYAIEVNQSGAQDIQVHKKDFNLLSSGGSGGGGGGVNELASDGTYIYMARTDSESPGIAEIFKLSPPNTLVASGTISGVSGQDIKAVYQGVSLYIVGAASGPTTFAADAAVWKVDPNTIVMLSSRTLDSTLGQRDDIIMGSTVTPSGSLVLVGAIQASATTYAAALWSYNTGSDALTLLSSGNAPGSNTDLFNSVASTGSAVLWMVGHSSETAQSGRDKMGLALWRYQNGALQFVSRLSGFGDSLDMRADITASASNLFVGTERRNSASNLDLAFIKYDLAGSSVVESYWHTGPSFRHEITGGIVLDGSGDPVIAGGNEGLSNSTGTSAYWRYTATTGALAAGFPKTLGDGRFYKPIRHGADVYASVHQSSTPILLTGGTSIAGVAGLQGSAVPLAFTFSGSPATSLKVNSNNNQNETAYHVYVDTNSGNLFAQWQSTTGSPGSQPAVISIGKFAPNGTLLSSVTLQGNRAGDGMILANGFLYVQERSQDYTLFKLTKFDLNLGVVASVNIDTTTVGNLTNVVARDGFLYYGADGSGSPGGGAKLIKFDANLNQIAVATYTGIAGTDHHNADALAVDGIGNFYLAVSSGEGAGLAHHVVKYDSSLIQLSSANVTNQFPSVPRLAYGGGTLYVAGSDAPTQKVFLRKFSTGLAYSGQSTTITVVGATPQFNMQADSLGNAVLALTSSTADGGDILAFKFDANLLQLSSGQFDGGFASADSGFSINPESTGTVILGGMALNSSHYDAVVLRRSLPAAAAGGGAPGPALTFAGTFAGVDGAKITSSNGFNLVGHQILHDTVSSGGPFTYIAMAATTGAVGETPNVEAVVRYDASGTFISSVTLIGIRGGNGLIQDSAGNIYVGDSNGDGPPIGDRFIAKYSKELAFISSAPVLTNNPAALFWDGTNVFVHADRTMLIRMNTNLTVAASAQYTAQPDFTNAAGGALDGAGNIFLGVDRSSGGFAIRLLRYPLNFANGASPALDVNVSTALLPKWHQGGMASVGGNLFVAANSTDGTKTYIRKFDSSLNYTGVSSTFTNTTALFGTRLTAAPGGNLFLVTSVSGTVSDNAYLAVKYDANLVQLSSAVFNGISNTGGGPAGVVAVDANSALITGASCSGLNPGDCKAATVLRSLPGGAGGGPAHEPFAFAGTFGGSGGARVNSANSQNELLQHLAVSTTAGVAFGLFHSTSAPLVDSPDVTVLVKYDLAGALLSTRALQGTHTGDAFAIAPDGSMIFVGEQIGQSSVWISRYDGNLVFHSSVTLSTTTHGSQFRRLAWNANALYAAFEGGSSARVFKYNAGLGELASGSYQIGSDFTLLNDMAVDEVGQAFIAVSTPGTGAPRHLVKFAPSLGAPSASLVASAYLPADNNEVSLAVGAAGLYSAALNPQTPAIELRRFNLDLTTTSVLNSIGGVHLGGFGARAQLGPGGGLYVVMTSSNTTADIAVLRFESGLSLLSSATFNGPVGGADLGIALAVVSATAVYAGGASQGSGTGFDSVAMLMNMSAPAAGGGTAFFRSSSIIGVNIPTDGTRAFLELKLWSEGGNAQVNGLRLSLLGDAPAPSVFAKVFRDSNGNGAFESGSDEFLGGASFSGTPPTASVTLSTISVSGSTGTYFLGFDFFSLPPGKTAGLAIDAASAFKFSNGLMAANQGPFPVESAKAVVRFSLAGRPASQGYPDPKGGSTPSGGFDTNLFINPGQRVAINASGVWNTNEFGTSGPGGVSGVTNSTATLPSANVGSLIARIGGSSWFFVGSSTDFVSAQSGSLALAMNDTNYGDNSGALDADFRIVPSTVTRTWLGSSGFGRGADIAQNWQDGQTPQSGESVRFDGAVSNADCDWNIYQANIGAWMMTNGYSGTVRIKGSGTNADDFNAVYASSHVVIGSGRLDLGRNKQLHASGALLVRGVLDLGVDNNHVRVGAAGARFEAGGRLDFFGPGFALIGPSGFETLPFVVADGTVDVRGAGLLRLERTDEFTLSAGADIRAFHNVQFDDWGANDMPAFTLARSSAAVLAFKGLEFTGGFLKNVDASGVPAGASITMLDSRGPLRGTPNEVDPNGVLFWNPDGGGFGSLSGDVLDGGVTIAGSTMVVRASTQPFFDPKAPQGGLVFQTSRQNFGSYTLPSLDAPATYYIFAWRDSVENFFPEGQEPRGGFGKPGLFRSDPVFVATGAALTGVNVTLKDWGEVEGSVSNDSAQIGPILIGAAHVNSTTTLESISFMLGGGPFPRLSVPATSLLLIGWVDANNNRRLDGFEAFGTQGVELAQAGISSPVFISISGGEAPPGGTVALAPSVPHGGLVGDSLPQPMFRLVLTSTEAQSALSGLKVDIAGGPSQNSYNLSAWVDGNGDGRLDPFCSGASGSCVDFPVGSAFIAPPVSSAIITFHQVLLLDPDQPRGLFLAFEPGGLSVGHQRLAPLSLTLAASNYFLMGAGSMASGPAYPLVSSAAIGWSAMGHTQGDSFGGGGYFTGLSVAAGQQVTVRATGTWNFNGTQTSPSGISGTEGQPTLSGGNRVGALLVSAGGGWVAVGTGTTITAPFNTGIHLSANDVPGDYFNNFGAVTADITVSGSTTSYVQGTIAYEGGLSGNLVVNLTQDCSGSTGPGVCAPVLSTRTIPLVGGTTLYAYGLHIPFGGFFGVQAAVDANPNHRSSRLPMFEAPMAATATVNFTVFSGLGSISGTLDYSGIMDFGQFQVGVTTSTDFEREVFFVGDFEGPSSGVFTVSGLPAPATYYMVGFRDGNFNQEPDGPEPLGAYASVPADQLVLSQLSSVLLPIFLPAGGSATGIVLPLADRGGISGRLFFQEAVAGGQVVIAAAHGLPGSPEHVFENRDFRFVENIPAGGRVDYFLGLLKPATDYTLFAFLDQNFNGLHDSGEPFAATFDFLGVPKGGFANKDLTVTVSTVPPAVQGFGMVNFGTNFVEFLWNSVPNATGYLLLDASSATVQALAASATAFNQALAPAALSAITGIRAVNAQGPGPITRLPVNLIAASAAVPVAAPTFSNLFVSSVTVSWANGGNSASAKYQLERATGEAGPFTPVQYDVALTKTDRGLAPASTFYYRVLAQSPNGGFAAPSATASVTAFPTVDPSVTGALSYAGRQVGRLQLEAYASSGPFSGLAGSQVLPAASLQPYYLAVPNGSYFLRAFVDVDGDGLRDAGEDQGTLGPVAVSGPVGGQDFSVSVDTTPTGPASGLAATLSLGRVDLRWNAPSAADLAGFRVQRTTSGAAGFSTLSAGTVFGTTGTVAGTTFTDASPVGGVDNVYRVISVDFGSNEALPSGALGVRPEVGGTISGSISSFTTTTKGSFRVRLSTSPRRQDPFLAESTLGSFSFAGLADGVYYLRGFRDLNADNRQDAAVEPSGTHGGLAAPFPLSIVGGNTVSGRTVTICDRMSIVPGQNRTGTLGPGDCRAVDKGPNNFTDLYTFRVGGGAAGSLGVGSRVHVGLHMDVGPELIVLGPSGQVVARSNTPGFASAEFDAVEPGLYLIEPTTFDSGASAGFYEVRLDVFGGFGGVLKGTVSYSGSRTGPIRLQLFEIPDADAFPFLVQDLASTGTFSIVGLRDGTFYLRAFRDVNFNFAKDPGEPTGVFGVSASSPTAVSVVGGVPSPSDVSVALADPSTGRIEGAIARQGSLTGPVRVEVGPRACPECSDLDVVAFSTISLGATNYYRLEFLPPSTSYIVQAFVDGNLNSRGDALEAKGSSSPVTVQANSTSVVNVLVRDPGTGASGTSVVFGTVSYAGSQTGTVFVGFAADQNFSYIPYFLTQSATGAFSRSGLAGGTTYYVGAFIDVNGNGTIDEDGAIVEPSGGYEGQLFVPNSSSVGVAFSIQDPPGGALSGVVTYTGALSVSSAPVIVVQARREDQQGGHSEGGFRQVTVARTAGVSTYSYTAGFLAAGNFRVYAFVDANLNQRSDFGEPFFSRNSLVAVSSGAGSSPVTGVDVVVFDAGAGGGSGEIGRIEGMLSYSGGQPGPVVVQAFTTNTYVGLPFRTVNAGGGPSSFSFVLDNLPAGTYFLRAFKDGNSDGFLQGQYEANGLVAAGSGIAVTKDSPFSGGHVGTLVDPGFVAEFVTANSLQFEVHYRGGFSSGTFQLALFQDADLDGRAGELLRRSTFAFSAAPFTRTFSDLPSGQFYLRGFLDRDGSLAPSADEPFGVTDAQGISVFGPAGPVVISVCDRTVLPPGATFADTIGADGCFSRESETLGAFQKLLTFRGARGQIVDLEMDSAEDNFLYLYDEQGVLVAQADEGGSKQGNARISGVILPNSGAYTLAATYFSANVTGPFRILQQNSGGTPGSLAGEVRYSGSQGGQIVMGLFNSPDFDSGSSFVDGRELAAPGPFSFSSLASGTSYFMGAFVDVNFNRQPDPGEDFAVFSTAPPAATPIFLQAGQDVSGLVLQIAVANVLCSTGSVSGVVSYSGAQAGALGVEFWADASFSGRPLGFRSAPTGIGPYDLEICAGPYVVRAFIDSNGDRLPGPDEPQGVYSPAGQGAEPVYVPAGGFISGVDIALRDPGIRFGQGEPSGEGSIAAAPATLSAGGLVDKVTFTYVAAGRGVREGGVVVVGVPFGFPFPQNGAPAGPGYVAAPQVTNPGGINPTLALSFPEGVPALEFKVTGATPLYSGATVQFTYANVSVPCFAFDLRFFAGSASTGTVPPAPLFSGAPVVALGAGTAATIRSAENSIGLLQNTTSQRLLLEAADNCGNRVAVGANANVILRAKRYVYATGTFDDTATLRLSSAATGVFDSTAVVTVLAGRSTATYRAVGLAGGDYFVELASNLLAPGSTGYAALTVFSNNSLSDVSVATVPFLLGRTSATITPNGDPASPNQAFINFTLGDPTRFWTVSIASSPYKLEQTPEPVAFFSGNGQPARGQIAWDGRDFRGARVPRGVYYVRVDVGGLRNDLLRVTVQASELKLKVFDAGVTPNLPLSNVSIESFGTLGGGSGFVSDSNGELTMAGLGAGEYRLRFQKDGYLPGRATVSLSSFSTISSMTATDSNVALSSNAAGLLSVRMGRAPSLVVVPSIAVNSTQTVSLWGSLQVENTTAGFVTNGPMHLHPGATTFDDGGQWDPSLQQFLAKTILRFNLASGTYTVRASLPGFDQLEQSVFVRASGQTTLTLPAFTRRSAFIGQVFLPAGYNTQGTFVSVSAVPITTTTALSGGSGGVFVPAAVDTATYRVDGLRPGSYRLTANTQGLKNIVIASATVIAGADTVVDFSSFPAANSSVIVATIGVTGLSGSSFPGLPPALRLNISAWAPNTPNGFYQTVDVSTIGVSSQTVVVNMTGLDEGVQYQLFAGLQGNGEDSGTPEFDVVGGFPKLVTVSTTTGRGEVAFDFAAASGVIRGVIYLPDTFGDFVNVDLYGQTIASARPDQVGKTFTENALALPGFAVGAAVNAASFTVTGLNTETTDITLTYRTTGRSIRTRLSVVNGQTTNFLADLRDPTFKVTGQIANQVTDSRFNTNQLIVVNAGSVPVRDAAGNKVVIDTATVDLGGVGSVDSLARVLAIRQQFGVAASTSFNPATDRVGYLTTAGTYTIRNLSPGVYLLRTADIRTCATCQVVIPRRVQTVAVVDADVTASSFTLSDGFSVTGLIQLAGSVQDSGAFRLTLRNRRLEVVRSTGVTLGNAAANVAAGSVAYRLDGVPAGEFYTLSVEDGAAQPRYIGKPLSFPDPAQSPNGLAGSITGQNVSMHRAAYVTGNLKDAASGEVFTERNARVLPPNLRITAVANPWVEGGFAQAASSVSNRPIRADGTFLVGPLFPEVSYDLKVFQDKWDLAFLAQGSQNYAPTGVSGLTMQSQERRDVGTLSLNQGTSIKGTLVDAASTTTALGNIRVAAKPSFGSVELNVETYSNALGQFTLWVSTFVSPQFDVTVAPRDGNLAANGKRYQTVELPRFTVSASSINLRLTELASAVTGQVFTADGGALTYPFGESFPAAAVFLQPAGTNPKDNPLGDISVVTAPDGAFTVPALSSGAYVIRAVALGYGVASGTVTVTSTSFCISTTAVSGSCQAGLTLRRGGVVKGRISLPDGSSPSIDEIGGVAAADADFAKFVIGTVDVDQAARTVSGYSITGFDPGVAYNIVILPASREDPDVIQPAEGRGVTFTASESTTTKTINLTYARIVPDCEASAVESALGNNQFQIKISCVKPLRRQTSADDDVDRILSVSSCVVNGSVKTDTANDCGSILGGASKKIESDRKSITAIYRAGNDNEESFTLKLDALVATVDPATGENFRLSKLFTFNTLFRGEGTNEESRIVVSNTEEQVSRHRGRAIGLINSERTLNGDQFLVNFGVGAIDGCGPGDTDPNCQGQQGDNTKVKLTVRGSIGASDAANRAQATLGYVPSRIQALQARAGAFGPLAASTSTKNAFGKSPLSTFYDIFLPLGIRSQLTKAVDLTLPYDLSLSPNTPISDLQIWSKSQGNIGKAGCTGQLCPEKGNQRVDTINKTITVSVDHFSQFVVLNGPPALTGAATFAEQKPIAFNFPNPFDCRTRTVTCNVAEGSCAGGNVTGVGTVLHYAAPGPVVSLEHRFRIYNVAGELVDEFTKTANGGTHHYDFWDCTNSSGRAVASGVYILEYTVNGQKVYHKMAVIKGSGL